MGTVSVAIFDVAFIAERWFRHTQVLAPNTSNWQKILSVLAIIFAITGAVGMICLTIFDNLHHGNAHDAFLVVFM
jgi:hypothetical protein